MPDGRPSMMPCADRSSSTAGAPQRGQHGSWGGRILEIGVGTGLSFDDYDAHTEITGIDISGPMIARARARAKTGRYPFVKELAVMDAHALDYRDASFDCARSFSSIISTPNGIAPRQRNDMGIERTGFSRSRDESGMPEKRACRLTARGRGPHIALASFSWEPSTIQFYPQRPI